MEYFAYEGDGAAEQEDGGGNPRGPQVMFTCTWSTESEDYG